MKTDISAVLIQYESDERTDEQTDADRRLVPRSGRGSSGKILKKVV